MMHEKDPVMRAAMRISILGMAGGIGIDAALNHSPERVWLWIIAACCAALSFILIRPAP